MADEGLKKQKYWKNVESELKGADEADQSNSGIVLYYSKFGHQMFVYDQQETRYQPLEPFITVGSGSG